MKIDDPTYNQLEIEANPIWKRAFKLSECKNDSAPLGWSKYIPEAKAELEHEKKSAINGCKSGLSAGKARDK